MFGGKLSIDLICAYAEASNNDKVLGFAKNSGRKLGF